MSAAELASLAGAVYGPRWQSPLARERGINLRTVQRMAKHGIDRPVTADGMRRFLEERARAAVPSPADGTGAIDVLRPPVAALVAAAVAAGWPSADVVEAIRTAADEIARQDDGAPPQRDT